MTTLEHITAALTSCAQAQVAASQDAVDLTNARAEVTALSTVVAEQRNEIADQQAEIAALRARIAELEGGSEEPPLSTMLIGASVQRRGAESWGQALTRFEDRIDRRVQIVRRFTSTIPTAQTDVFAGLTGYHRILSFKGAATQAQLETWIRGLPVDGCRTYVASWHEPENDMTGAEFQARQRVLKAAIDAVGRDDVIPTIIVMSWWERDGQASTTSAAFFPPDPADWVLGLDPYDRWLNQELADLAGPTLELWRSRGGSRWMLAEVATKRKGSDAAAWIQRATSWAAEQGAEAFTWFDSKQGDDQGPTAGEGFYLDLRGEEAIEAFAALLPT